MEAASFTGKVRVKTTVIRLSGARAEAGADEWNVNSKQSDVTRMDGNASLLVSLEAPERTVSR